MSSEKRILIVDDEESIRRLLKLTLSQRGYRTEEAATGREGLTKAAQFHPHVIILDLGLPGVTGQSVLSEIRGWSNVPIIVLTAEDVESTKVKLLEAGADDYVTKPFGIPELVARIQVALRHRQNEIEASPVFSSGVLRVDMTSRQVTVADERVHLTATEFSVLRCLLRGRGRVVGQEEILAEVWGEYAKENPHYLRIYIGSLRKKLETDPSTPEHILTDPGIGYRLV